MTVAKTVKALAQRGVTIGRLLKMYKNFSSAGKIDEFVTTTEDVIQTIVAPDTKEYWSSFSVFFDKPIPEFYVIHAWKGLFFDLVLGLLRHATGILDPKMDPDNVAYERKFKASLEKSYWIDAFACNMNLTTETPGPTFKVETMEGRCETDKFDMVIQLLQLRGTEAVIIIDSCYKPL